MAHADEERELWNVIHRVACVLESVEEGQIHPVPIDGLLSTIRKVVSKTVGGKGKTEPPPELKSPKSNTYAEINDMITKYSSMLDSYKSKERTGTKAEKSAMKSRVSTLETLIKALNDQKSDLIQVHKANEDCDEHQAGIDANIANTKGWDTATV